MITQIQQLYAQHSDANNAANMQKYMKDKFIFYGIKTTPLLNSRAVRMTPDFSIFK